MQSFRDRMIVLVEGVIRQRTPNEIALTLVVAAFTLIFLIAVVALLPMARNAEQYMALRVVSSSFASISVERADEGYHRVAPSASKTRRRHDDQARH
jgi:high-affinity K+ transport system ATPase subunit B